MVLSEEICAAAEHGHHAAIQDWFSTGTRDPNEEDVYGRPLLVCATYGGQCDIIRICLQHGADVKLHGVLYVAASRGHTDAAVLLLDHGARVDFRSSLGYGWTPLFSAVTGLTNIDRTCDMIRLLLRHGVDINARWESTSFTAEAYARRNGKDEAADLLADVRLAGGWNAFVLFPRKRVLALRVLCEQGRASTDDALLRRLFPAAPPSSITTTLKDALEMALANQPNVRTLVDVDALAAAQARALADNCKTIKRTRADYRARDGGELPKELFWKIFEYWRSDRDSRF